MHNQKGPYAICETLNAYNALLKRAMPYVRHFMSYAKHEELNAYV